MSLLRSAVTPDRARNLDALATADLYLCTPSRPGNHDLRTFLCEAYAGGVDIIQLRDKNVETREEIAALEILADVAHDCGKLFAVNDRADIAALVGADVFHIGQGDLSAAQARALLGPEVIIGQSTHSPAQARTAMEDANVDYFCTGPVWETPTKPGRPATGLSLVHDTATMLAGAPELWQRNKAWFAIGGVNARTLPQVMAACAAGRGSTGGGARARAVVVRAITTADDPRAAAAELKALLAV